MDKNFKALSISELLPRPGRPGRWNRDIITRGSRVLIGDYEDIRLCETLDYAEVDHNWYSQHMCIKFTNGKKFWYPSQTINGKKVFLFRVTEKNLGFLKRKDYENKITNWTTIASAFTGDLIAVADLILESVGKEKKKQKRVPENSEWWPILEKSYKDVATEQILGNLNRLSVLQLKDLWECIDCPVSSAERKATSKAA